MIRLGRLILWEENFLLWKENFLKIEELKKANGYRENMLRGNWGLVGIRVILVVIIVSKIFLLRMFRSMVLILGMGI